MSKRRRKKAANPPAKRKRAKRRSGAHRRKAAHNPRKRAKRRTTHRRKAHNPGRRRAKRRHHHAHAPRRARRANPHRRHRTSKRRHRRNPGIPPWAMAGLAGALGLGTFALTTSAAFGLTKRFDPALTSLERNRYIAGAAATALGLAVAVFASPILGAGVIGGGLAALAGTQLSFAIDPVFQLGAEPAKGATAAQTTKGLGAVFDGNRQQLGMGAVFGSSGQNLGAVFNGQAQMLAGCDDGDDHYFGG